MKVVASKIILNWGCAQGTGKARDQGRTRVFVEQKEEGEESP
jgi:hypothetical protein